MRIKFLLLLTVLCLAFTQVGAQNIWTKKKTLTGADRYRSCSFSINGFGYVGCGYGSTTYKDFWKYDPILNSWTQVASSPVTRHIGYAFVIDNIAYVGGGLDANQFNSPKSSFYKYNGKANTWTTISGIPTASFGGVAWSSADKGYVCMGYNGSSNITELWEYDPVNDNWTQKTDFPGSSRGTGVAFSIGNKAYIGSGFDGSSFYDDFYCYNSDSDTWTQVSSFPAGVFEGGSSFTVGKTGYVVGGRNASNDLKSLYKYDAANDTWTKMKDYGGNGVRYCAAFSIGSRGYVGVGYQGSSYFNDFYMYETEARTIIADSIGNSIHCQSALDSIYFTAKNIYDTTNKFTIQISSDSFKTVYNVGTIKGADETKYVAAIKIPSNIKSSDSFNFRVVSSKPSVTGPISSTLFIIDAPETALNTLKDTICDGDSTAIFVEDKTPGSALKWFANGVQISNTLDTLWATASGKYKVDASGKYGCSTTGTDLSIELLPSPQAQINVSKDTACDGDSIMLSSTNIQNGYIYNWLKNNALLFSSSQSVYYTKSTGDYQLQLTDGNGCTDISQVVSKVFNPLPDAQIVTAKDSACFGDSILLSSFAKVAGNSYEWWLNGSLIPNQNNDSYTSKQSGAYSLSVKNINNCMSNSTSKNITFINLAKPTITLNGAVFLSTVASSYQWYKDGVAIANETLQTYIPIAPGVYTVSISNTFGCVVSSDPYSFKVGFFIPNTQIPITVFPNPTSSSIHIELEHIYGKHYRVQISNAISQKVYEGSINNSSSEINLTSQPNGLYFIQIYDGAQLIHSTKILKE
jgi:N-acetylneuraminic acid mutarotase